MTPSAQVAHRIGMRTLTTVVAVALVLATAAAGQPPIDLDRLGPQPGTRVPDFAAPDHTGTTRTLASVLGPRGAMLVFSRSADW